MADGELATAPPTIRVATPKPKFGIYHIFLTIALCALITSCIVLYVFIRNFGGFGTVQGKVVAIERPMRCVGYDDHGRRLPMSSPADLRA